jgi:cell shape-determining protein MreC
MKSNWLLLLPIAALLSALTLPPVRPNVRQAVATLFTPISAPTRMTGAAMRSRVVTPDNIDLGSPDRPRSLAELRQENEILRVQVANMQVKLDDLAGISAQYADMRSDLQRLVQPAAVVGGPTDQRQTLTISTTGLTNVREGMAVVTPVGYIGKIHSVSTVGGTARVLLATDPSSRLVAKFATYSKRADGTLDLVALDIPAPLVEGQQRQVVGNTRRMTAGPLQAGPVRKLLKVGDAVLLDESTGSFPPAVRGLRLGTVSKIDLPPFEAGHATVTIDPVTDFSTLREVLVVNKTR